MFLVFSSNAIKYVIMEDSGKMKFIKPSILIVIQGLWKFPWAEFDLRSR